MSALKLLTFNAHESYVHALCQIGHQWDIIDGLPGRYTSVWDLRMRPIPSNARLIDSETALTTSKKYDCIIAHSIDDLLLVKTLQVPKILIIHVSLSGYLSQEKNPRYSQAKTQQVLKTYLQKIRALTVSVSEMKQKTWDVTGPIIPFYIDSAFFNGYSGHLASGLRVANQLLQKEQVLNLQAHTQIIGNLPLKIAGHNPELPGVTPAKGQSDLRELYRSHRFYLHTARFDYEDGYNTASLEAMATGMPVICNAHPSAPVINGISGFISDDFAELHQRVRQLLLDQPLAAKLGAEARNYVRESHSLKQFSDLWNEAIAQARAQF